MRGKDAGLRTHTLVAISAAVTTLVALRMVAEPSIAGSDMHMDPGRVIQGIAQAVGFIAAGVMFRAGATVHGATTAALVWVSGALGIACGAGFFELAGMALGLCLLVTILLSVVERWLPESPNQRPSDPKSARD